MQIYNGSVSTNLATQGTGASSSAQETNSTFPAAGSGR